MLTERLARIKELIAAKEKIDAELEALIGGPEAEAPKRGRPRKARGEGGPGTGASHSDMDEQQPLPV